MILTCPSCGTRYVVKDGAIPDGGRTVRCAQCKHSWHQNPEDGVASPPIEAATPDLDATEAEMPASEAVAPQWDQQEPPVPESDSVTPSGQFADVDAAPTPPPHPEVEPDAATMPAEAAEASEPYPEEVVPAEDMTAQRSTHPLRAARAEAESDLYSPFAQHDGDAEPTRRWPLIAALTLLAIAAIAAAIWFLAPAELKNRLGIAQGDGGSPLLVKIERDSSQSLASNNILYEVSGLVINPTDETQPVPPIQAQLRSLEQRIVHRWVIPPPAPQLGPGASASFNSAELDIPASAACLEVFIGTQSGPQPVCRAADTPAKGV